MSHLARPRLSVLTTLLALNACSADPETSSATTGVPFPNTPTPMGSNAATSPSAGTPAVVGATGSETPPALTHSADATATASVLDDPLPPDESTPASRCVPGIPSTSQVPRLTNAQYNRTLYDLLGASPTGLLATEQAGDITKAEWDGYQFSADAVSQAVMADPTLRARYVACSPEGDGVACLSETIRDFGQRAYRRPLSEAEVAGYEGLVARRAELTATGRFDEVAELLLKAFLSSPHFIQRAELVEVDDGDGHFALSDFEVASRLSYMLWGTMPDPELFEAAAAARLHTKAEVIEQAERMVKDDKARPMLNGFHRGYLLMNVGRWTSARKNESLFPNWSDAVVADMGAETELLFDSVFTSGGTFQDLFTTTTAYVTTNTAPLYGLDPAQFSATPKATQLGASRPGFLTRVGFLAAYGDGDKTDIINRGAFITKQILGINAGIPDPAAATAKLPDDPTLDTTRKRVTALTEQGVCAACHIPLINPPGFVLEAFDTTGAAQTLERETGAAIDTHADVLFDTATSAVSIADPAELMQHLASAPAAARTYAAQLVGFAYGRTLTSPDFCTAESLAQSIGKNDSLQRLLEQITQTEYFLTRVVEVTQ